MARRMMYIDDEGKGTEVSSEREMVEAIKRDAGDSRNFEIQVSRKLIGRFRSWLVDQECLCESDDDQLCGRCLMLDDIDTEMKTIGERKNGCKTG